MANNDNLYAGMPIGPGSDVTIQNTEASADMASGDIVKIDTAHAFSTTQQVPGCVLTTTDDYPYAVCIEAIKNGKQGRARASGQVVLHAGTANAGVVTVGDVIQCDATHAAKTQAAGKPQLGQSLGPTTAAALDNFICQLSIAKNA